MLRKIPMSIYLVDCKIEGPRKPKIRDVSVLIYTGTGTGHRHYKGIDHGEATRLARWPAMSANTIQQLFGLK